MMIDFNEAAREYCKMRVEYLGIRRAMQATPCEWENDPDSERCWVAITDGSIREDDFCNACTANTPNRERRAELGKKMPYLMRKMLRAYRWEVNNV